MLCTTKVFLIQKEKSGKGKAETDGVNMLVDRKLKCNNKAIKSGFDQSGKNTTVVAVDWYGNRVSTNWFFDDDIEAL